MPIRPYRFYEGEGLPTRYPDELDTLYLVHPVGQIQGYSVRQQRVLKRIFLGVNRDLERIAEQKTGVVERIASPKDIAYRKKMLASVTARLLEQTNAHVIFPLYGTVPMIKSLYEALYGSPEVTKRIHVCRIMRSHGMTLRPPQIVGDFPRFLTGPNQQPRVIVEDIVDKGRVVSLLVETMTENTVQRSGVLNPEQLVRVLEYHNIFLVSLFSKNTELEQTLARATSPRRTFWQQRQGDLAAYFFSCPDKWVMGGGPDTGYAGRDVLQKNPLQAIARDEAYQPLVELLAHGVIRFGASCDGALAATGSPEELKTLAATLVANNIQAARGDIATLRQS